MDKLKLIKDSLSYIDRIATKYLDFAKQRKALDANFIGEEKETRENTLVTGFKNGIAFEFQSILNMVNSFIKADAKDSEIDINNVALFNVGNALATTDTLDLNLITSMVKPFATDKKAIAFLKGMAKANYKPMLEFYENTNPILESISKMLRDIEGNPVGAIGEISDIRSLILQYANKNGLDVEDAPSSDFNTFKTKRIASLMGVEL